MKTRFVPGQLYLVDGEVLSTLAQVRPHYFPPSDVDQAIEAVVATAEPWGGPPDPTPEELAELFPDVK